MPRGWFDFGNVESLLSGKQIDPTELLYQLTGIGLIDGLGKTMFFTNFENGLNGWYTHKSGDAKKPYIDIGGINGNLFSSISKNMIILNPGTLGSGECVMQKEYLVIEQKKLGLELGYSVVGKAPAMYVKMSYNYNGLSLRHVGVMIDFFKGTIDIDTTAGVVNIYNFPAYTYYGQMIQQLKIVGNFEKGEYVKLYFAEKLFDLSDYFMAYIPNAVKGNLYIKIHIYPTSLAAGEVYMYYVRLSKDEP